MLHQRFVQVAHEHIGLLLVRQIEIDPLRRRGIPDRDRTADDSATALAGLHAKRNLVSLTRFGVCSDVGISQSLRPLDRVMGRFVAVDEYPIALVDLAQIQIQRIGKSRRQLNGRAIPADTSIGLIALILPRPADPDRLPASVVMIRREPAMPEALVAGVGRKPPQRRDVQIERWVRGQRPA